MNTDCNNKSIITVTTTPPSSLFPTIPFKSKESNYCLFITLLLWTIGFLYMMPNLIIPSGILFPQVSHYAKFSIFNCHLSKPLTQKHTTPNHNFVDCILLRNHKVNSFCKYHNFKWFLSLSASMYL